MALLDEPLLSASPPRSLLAGTARSLRDLVQHRELLVLLVKRELKSRYKDSALGFVWSLMRPLAQLLIYYVAIGKFLGAERQIPSFAIYIFTGLCVWSLFSEGLSSTTTSIVDNSGLVKKVYLPRELFPLSALGSALFNFAVQFLVLLAAVLLTQPFPFITSEFWMVPLAFLGITLFTLACGLLLAALNVYLRDIKHLVEVLLLVLFWASPIVYSFTMVHDALAGNWVEQVYLANPVTIAVIGFQQGMWAAGAASSAIVWPPDMLLRLVGLIVVSVALIWFSQRVFSRLAGNFAQEM